MGSTAAVPSILATTSTVSVVPSQPSWIESLLMKALSLSRPGRRRQEEARVEHEDRATLKAAGVLALARSQSGSSATCLRLRCNLLPPLPSAAASTPFDGRDRGPLPA